MHQSLEKAITGLLVVAAGYLTFTAVRREVTGSNPTVRAETFDRPPERLSEWSSLVSAGVLIGDSTDALKVLVLSDLECPYCKRFHERIRKLQALEPGVAMVFVHYPLERHRFALPAARALECAGTMGRFDAFLDQIFAKQDSLGLKPFSLVASDAGVADTTEFKKCASKTGSVDRVERGIQLGRSIGVRGTPTVVINGWRFHNIPDDRLLSDVLNRLRNGEPPPGVSVR